MKKIKLPIIVNLMSVNYDIIYKEDYNKVHPESKEMCFAYLSLWTNQIFIHNKERDINDVWGLLFSRFIFYISENFRVKFKQKEKEINRDFFKIGGLLADFVIRNNICFNSLTQKKNLNIAGINYKIKYDKKLCKSGDEEVFGVHDPFNDTINIYTGDRKLNDYWQTLWHEVLHSIFDFLKIDFFKGNDEVEDNYIDLLSIILNDICIRNKFCFNKKCNVCKNKKK